MPEHAAARTERPTARELGTALGIREVQLPGIARTRELFVSYNWKDSETVCAVFAMLDKLGVKARADEGPLAGNEGDDCLKNASEGTTPVAMFLGTNGVGDKQERHLNLFKREESSNGQLSSRRILVLLPGASANDLPQGLEFDETVRYAPHIIGVGSVAEIFRTIRAEELAWARGGRRQESSEREEERQVPDRIRRLANYIASDRKLGEVRGWLRELEANPDKIHREIASTHEEQIADWLAAQKFFACDALLGRVNMARQFSSDSYCHLEEVWVDDVKDVIAYLAWEAQKSVGEEPDRERYRDACQELNEMVFDRHIKAGLGDFVQVAEYIGNRFLHRGKLDRSKPATGDLIAKKAECVWRHTGRGDDRTAENERAAISFVRDFYQNIVPAVEEDDLRRLKAVLETLKAGGDDRYRNRLLSCFEAALLIYFLNPDTLRQACEEVGLQTDEVL
jgi:hypothetical protein